MRFQGILLFMRNKIIAFVEPAKHCTVNVLLKDNMELSFTKEALSYLSIIFPDIKIKLRAVKNGFSLNPVNIAVKVSNRIWGNGSILSRVSHYNDKIPGGNHMFLFDDDDSILVHELVHALERKGLIAKQSDSYLSLLLDRYYSFKQSGKISSTFKEYEIGRAFYRNVVEGKNPTIKKDYLLIVNDFKAIGLKGSDLEKEIGYFAGEFFFGIVVEAESQGAEYMDTVRFIRLLSEGNSLEKSLYEAYGIKL